MKLADKLAKTAGKMSPRKLILLCAFFALMIFIILYSTLSSFEDKKEEKPPEAAGVAVIEAATDISPRTVITDDMLKASVVPESLLPPGALTDKKLIVGHKAGVTILAGDVITRRKLDVSAAAVFRGSSRRGCARCLLASMTFPASPALRSPATMWISS